MCLLKNKNNSYIDYTTTTLSHHLNYHLSENSAIKQDFIIKHSNSTNQLTFSNVRKILTDNSIIIYKSNNKKWLHILAVWRSRDELISDVLLWTPTYGRAKSRTTSLNIRTAAMWGIRDVALKTCRKRWTIGRSGERGSGISKLAAWHDDDDDDDDKS